MARDADATRTRILDAAEIEFAAYGIAGARIDRIAENAQANKALIYKYFGNKDQLFDTVFVQRAAVFVEQVDFDVADLPGYAGRSFDLWDAYPRTLRLALWYQLERPDGDLPEVRASTQAKLDRLAEAQAAGLLPTTFTPLELLTEVRALAMSWHLHTPEMARLPRPDRERRRALVVESVRRLVAA